jgi:hypothetical protein
MLGFFAKPRNNTKKENQKYIPDEAKKMAKKDPLLKQLLVFKRVF